jgi:hypothetical protein
VGAEIVFDAMGVERVVRQVGQVRLEPELALGHEPQEIAAAAADGAVALHRLLRLPIHLVDHLPTVTTALVSHAALSNLSRIAADLTITANLSGIPSGANPGSPDAEMLRLQAIYPPPDHHSKKF